MADRAPGPRRDGRRHRWVPGDLSGCYLCFRCLRPSGPDRLARRSPASNSPAHEPAGRHRTRPSVACPLRHALDRRRRVYHACRAAPGAREQGPGKGWALFEAIEKRFSRQVRWSIPLAGATGLWTAWRLNLWAQFADPAFWWLDAMVLLWALFMLIVFVVEPIAHARLTAQAAHDPGAVLRRLARAHIVLLSAAIVTIVGAVAGAHGGLFG
jgi:hypothetical protein